MTNTGTALILTYIGIGLLLSAAVLWNNLFDLKEDAHPIVVLYAIVATTVTWGMWAVMGLAIIIIDAIALLSPFKVGAKWWGDQFE